MPNTGKLRLVLLTVDGQPAVDPDTLVRFHRASDGTTLGQDTTAFPSNKRYVLPAFPQEHALTVYIAPSRYRARMFGPFTLTSGEELIRQPTVFRNPKAWSADFDRWNALDDVPGSLRALLDASPDLLVKGGRRFDSFTAAAYDGVPDDEHVTVYAKSCLLNLYAKLATLNEPVHNRKPWFRFIERVLEISRERLIAIVDDEMIDRVRAIKSDLGAFADYKHTPAGNHHGNIPAGYRVVKSEMLSVKTTEDKGNLQLTLSPATDPSGAPVTLLDADIDENGTLLGHLADLFKHKFTGGTHPYDIHEFLRLEDQSRPLSYRLV